MALPPLLVHVMHAAEMAGPCGYAEALKAFGELAMVLVPTSGLFDLEREDVRQYIRFTAVRHLASDEMPAATPERRSDREGPAAPGETVSNIAHLLFGLAMGLTFAGLTTAPACSR